MAHATNIPGQKVSQGSCSAFVPAPLPPEPADISRPELDPVTDRGTLGCGATRRKTSGRGWSPSQSTYFDPAFVQREAVLSSKIKGTQATPGELLAAEAGAIADHSPRIFGKLVIT